MTKKSLQSMKDGLYFVIVVLSCLQENVIILIVFYSLDHLNKHFRILKIHRLALEKC